jgi:hypothetical protein
MHRFIRRFTAIVLVAFACVAAAELVIVEEAVEAQPLDLKLTSPSSGLVYASTCGGCKPLQLVVTHTTRASFAGKPLALTDLEQYAELGATVFYDKATRVVTRIEIWK